MSVGGRGEDRHPFGHGPVEAGAGEEEVVGGGNVTHREAFLGAKAGAKLGAMKIEPVAKAGRYSSTYGRGPGQSQRGAGG